MRSLCNNLSKDVCEVKNNLNLLLEISNELNSNDISLDNVLSMLQRQLKADVIIISVLNRKKGLIYVEGAYGVSGKDISHITYTPGEGVIGKVIKDGTTVIVPCICDSKEFSNKMGLPFKINDLDVSFLCIPLIDKNEVIGALSIHKVYHGVPNFKENMQLLSIVGSMIARAVRRRQKNREAIEELQKENLILKEAITQHAFSSIVGNSGKLQEVFSLIKSVAPTQTTVLIRGESGVGKELIADALHYSSKRSNKPFIKVNCAALPDNLIESELFGHEKGSFTGANNQRIGRFEAADGGTIFLDEFGDIPLSTQVKLLRVIQQKEIERIGSTKSIKVDVRIICATNKNLEEMISNGIFREDLYYRINVFPLYIPALRERLHDIPTLVDHFIEKYNKINNGNIRRITASAIDALLVYHWPGNIRELENCIERCCILSSDGVIHTHNLPPTIQNALSSQTEHSGTLDTILGKIEKQILQDALISTKGNMAKAASSLGITERMMGLRIRKYLIDPKRFKVQNIMFDEKKTINYPQFVNM